MFIFRKTASICPDDLSGSLNAAMKQSFKHQTCGSPPEPLCSSVNRSLNKLLISALFPSVFGVLPRINLNDCFLLICKEFSSHCLWRITPGVNMCMQDLRRHLSVCLLDSLQGNPLFDWTPVIAVKYLCHLFDGGWRCLITQRSFSCSGWKHDIPGKILRTFFPPQN